MKKYIFSLFVLCFSFLFLAGCSNTQTPQSIQLQGTTIVAPEYDDIKIAGKFILAKKMVKALYIPMMARHIT